MLEASDRQQVIKWSQRQLGAEAGLLSIMEVGSRQSRVDVERSGTGISAMERSGCIPLLGLMADSEFNIYELQQQGRSWSSESEELTWH